MSGPEMNEVVLCATHRLARSRRLAAVVTSGGDSGPGPAVPLPTTATIAQWLDGLIEEALLVGAIGADAMPVCVLSPQQERALWVRVIGESLGDDAAASLFDIAGLAAEAMVANALVDTWALAVASAPAGEETARFLAWGDAFRAFCAERRWMPESAYRAWQVAQVEAGVGRLPARVGLAGFDRFNPLEQRLCAVLAARGCPVEPVAVEAMPAPQPRAVALDDVDAECRAVAHWAAETLAGHPDARIGIVMPDLAARRAQLTRLLDHVLDAGTVRAAEAQRQRPYNLSLGTPLVDMPPVAVALDWLRLVADRDALADPQGLVQTDLGAFLIQPYWAADGSEADARALFDAQLRAGLPLRTSFARVMRLARKAIAKGLPLHRSANAIERLVAQRQTCPARALPSAWREALTRLLDAIGWPGERSPSSHDYQACAAFREAIAALQGLDAIVGEVGFAGVLAHLAEACAEQVFQPETEGMPRIQILGMLEAAGERFDALWVMGMNDHLWPPPARPSPLLPARLQRSAGCPNASPEVQLAFAAGLHARLLGAAPAPVFSWALREGESELRPSPLLADIPIRDAVTQLADTLAERRLVARSGGLQTVVECIDDARAPPVPEGEHVRGGTGLLRTQAICPAWAFYRYRLGAESLETPVDGLDAMERGSLVHAVLEAFWRDRSSTWLAALGEAALTEAIAHAVEAGLAAFVAGRELPLPPRFLALERTRLNRLLALWVALEARRPAGFSVVACEQKTEVEIEGIALRLFTDRIDRLDDGRALVLDYKTGATLDVSSWASTRITEPQLPIYATQVATEDDLAGIAFAQVRLKTQRFAGIAAEADLLPGVAGLDEGRKLFDEERFPDWPSLLAHWRTALAAIAREVRAGEAAVRLTREQDLAYCDVLPILRLAERAWLYEQARAKLVKAEAA